jgi:glycosyltransferase involved in cell wall biosynthesis
MKETFGTLLVVSHVFHYQTGRGLLAYGPYSLEIEVWADLFEQVIIAAPRGDGAAPKGCSLLERDNISLWPLRPTGGTTWRAKLAQAFAVPGLLRELGRAMRQADVIHVRCPGNVGLLGTLLAPLYPARRIAKYAGQWGHYPGEAWSYRLQRAVLRSRWWGAPVTVYGRWPNQPPHVVPFFTSVMTDAQVARAGMAAMRRGLSDRPRVIYVGRLSAAKNVDVLLLALSVLRTRGMVLPAQIVGDGPEGAALRSQAESLGIADQVEFLGAVSFEQVLDCYEEADVLVLCSETEGWPKAIAEAMAFGLVCVGSDRGMVPKMLSEGRGVVISPRNLEALVAALGRLAAAPLERQIMSARAAEWARHHSLEGLRDALAELLAGPQEAVATTVDRQ